MSTDVITGNDLKAILGDVLPAARGIFCELIWTNPNGNTNLTCTMGESTVTIDKHLSNYDGFIVEFRNYYNAGDKTTEIYFSKCQGMYGRTIISATLSNPTISYGRHWYPVNSSNGFYFSDCTRYTSNAASVVGSDTGCLVPMRIYGFKLHGAPRQSTEIDGLLDTFYPIGSYYETSDISFDPNVSWGGTWVLETEGQVHVSAGTNYEVGDTGGEASHTILSTEIPDHDHELKGTGFAAISNYSNRSFFNNLNTPVEAGVNQWTTLFGSAGYTWTHNADAAITTSVENYNNAKSVNLLGKTGKSANPTSGSNDLSLMQPYVVVNRWHRVG